MRVVRGYDGGALGDPLQRVGWQRDEAAASVLGMGAPRVRLAGALGRGRRKRGRGGGGGREGEGRCAVLLL